jgi:hypothetical protein
LGPPWVYAARKAAKSDTKVDIIIDLLQDEQAHADAKRMGKAAHKQLANPAWRQAAQSEAVRIARKHGLHKGERTQLIATVYAARSPEDAARRLADADARWARRGAPKYVRGATDRYGQPARANRRNKGSNHDMKPKGKFKGMAMTIQTLLFGGGWKPTEAQEWALEHGFKAHKIDQPAEYIRIRQAPPTLFKPNTLRTITLTTKYGGNKAVKAVTGIRKPVDKKKQAEASKAKAAMRNPRGSKRALIDAAWERQGVTSRTISDGYGPRRGLEGPFRFKGRVLYYDAREGRYYDPGKDMYLGRDEDPNRNPRRRNAAVGTRLVYLPPRGSYGIGVTLANRGGTARGVLPIQFPSGGGVHDIEERHLYTPAKFRQMQPGVPVRYGNRR